MEVTKYSWEITESRIKNLLKKPARGGIPAIEKSVKVKLITNVKFFSPAEVQLDIQLGKREVERIAKISSENNKTVNAE